MLNSYLAHLEEKGKSENTLNSYVSDLQQFFIDMNISPDDFVTESDVRKWLDSLLYPSVGCPLAVSTINRRINALRSFYTWAASKGFIKTNPMRDIEDIKSANEEHENIQWLTEDEFQDLLERMRKIPVKSRGVDPEEKYRRDRAIVFILTYGGLRVDELSNLKVTDLDLEMKKIRIVGKGKKIRINPVPMVLYHEMKDWLKYRNEKSKEKQHIDNSPYVFYSQRSEKLSVRAIQYIIESYSIQGRKLTPHMFRHTFCKWMLKATNNDLQKVRRFAGHSSITTTSRYLRDSYDELVSAVEELPRF